MALVNNYKLSLRFLLCFGLAVNTARAQNATTDTFAIASSILKNTHNCDSALQLILQLSSPMHETAGYYQAMGDIYTCKNNTEYANIYYEKARNAGGKNTSLPMAGTDNGDKQTTNTILKAEREKLKRQATRPDIVHTPNLDGFYVAISLGRSYMVGGKKAMAGRGFAVQFPFGWTLNNTKFTIDVTPSLGAVWGKNPQWYKTEAYLQNPVPVGDGLGLAIELTPAFNYMLINSRRHTIIAGALLSGRVIADNAWIENTRNEMTASGQAYLCPGLRAAYFGWHRIYVEAEYQHVGLRKLHAGISEKGERVPVNLDFMRVSVGILMDAYRK